ncbi:MAG: Asp-tRNA(Asn)/Glu-tRNA(Gln) amidotransferase subunit GatC [Solirubrobacterales bacterium]|nr:Asp-tRNA(Asn)/Glu-tRNA(Gln) amidotransferase subunit GatC [Solirubrobacterales bacterium]
MIDRSEVLHIAKLARLSISDEEVDVLAAELSGILDHVEMISKLNLAGVEPSAHSVAQTGWLRPDVPHQSLAREKALDQAPATDGEGFEVPPPGSGT